MSRHAGGDPFRLVPAESIPRSALNPLLKKHQAQCVQLCERLANPPGPNAAGKTGGFVCLVNNKNSAVHALVFASPAGLVLHCIPELDKDRRAQAAGLLAGYMQGRELYCISGAAYGTRLMEAAAEMAGTFRPPVERRDHSLMVFRPESAPGGKAADAPVELCTEGHLEKLLPLQCVYDTVEVLPANRRLDIGLCRKTLLKGLRQERVYGIRQADGFAAKAAVNAAAEGYWQIGGVFTRPDCRGKGYAARLTRFIAERALREGKGAVLFVRTENAPAIRAYTNAGFVPCGSYSITYY